MKVEGPTDGDMTCENVTYEFESREQKVAGLRITMCFSTLITNPNQNFSTGLTCTLINSPNSKSNNINH